MRTMKVAENPFPRMYSVRDLRALMSKSWKCYVLFVSRYGTLLRDIRYEKENKREQFYLYKDQYWNFTKVDGVVTLTGWSKTAPLEVLYPENAPVQLTVK